MPNATNGHSDGSSSLPDVIHSLRQHDNPFDVFVQPDRHFDAARWHVPDVNRTVYERIDAAVARYQLGSSMADPKDAELPRSGAVIIFGKRGAGKTHLRHVLEADDSCLTLTPSRLETHRDFPEYLLVQLVTRLQEEAYGDGPSSLATLADWFTRNVLVQSLYAMPDREWLAHNATSRWRILGSLVRWGSARILRGKAALIDDLRSSEQTIDDLCVRHGADPWTMLRITMRQLDDTASAKTTGGKIRLRLYQHLVHYAFSGADENVFNYLLSGFAHVAGRISATREVLVQELLSALVELFLLSDRPVVFAFDALESLLKSPPDEELCRYFFTGITEVISTLSGIPLFVFAESGHWHQAARYLDSYMAQRFQQGVPTRGFGSIHELAMPDASLFELQKLVAYRMRGLLERQNANGLVGSVFPFQEADIERAVRGAEEVPPLRQLIQTLRDRYSAIVFQPSPAAPSTLPSVSEPDTSPMQLLVARWQRELHDAELMVGSGRPSLFADQLHIGTQRWLRHVIAAGQQVQGWQPVEARTTTFAKHLVYGQMVRTVWRQADLERRLGIGFLLGVGKGMPADLETKLKMIAACKRPVDSLVILWPRDVEFSGSVVEQLPPATRDVWNRYTNDDTQANVRMEAIDPADVAPWLVCAGWDDELQDELPTDELGRFILERTHSLLELVTPQA